MTYQTNSNQRMWIACYVGQLVEALVTKGVLTKEETKEIHRKAKMDLEKWKRLEPSIDKAVRKYKEKQTTTN